MLGFLRDRGAPFVRGADDATLRTLAVGLRAAARRTAARTRSRAHADDHAAPTGSTFVPLADEDAVTLLDDNGAAFEARCDAIDAAERTVDCALYYLADDETGRRFAEHLGRASARGVRVRLAVDRYASIEKQFGPFARELGATRGALVLLDTLERAGCEVHLLGDDTWAMHRKFLLVDEATLMFGGRNVADHYATPGWRDLDLAIRGPLARSLVAAATSTLDAPTCAPTHTPGVVIGMPGGGGRAYAGALADLVRSATATLDIEHAYVLSHTWLDAEIGAAVRRGVRVRVLTNSVASNDLPFMGWRLATTLRSLLRAGAEIFVRKEAGATLHTKLVVADRRRVLFGSTNLDYYSPAYCAELDLAIESERLGASLEAFIDRGTREDAVAAVLPGSIAAQDLERECSPWSVSRVCDLLIHDMQ